MKKVLLVVMIMLFLSSLTFGNELVFSVKPGSGIQTSSIGLEFGKFTPYLGVDLLSISAKVGFSEKNWDEHWDTGNMYLSSTYSGEISGNATLFIPNLGLKYTISEKALKKYIYSGFFKCLAFGKMEGESVWKEYDSTGQIIDQDIDNYEIDSDYEDAIKDILGIWGINVGFGAEYPLSESFSIGGEYSIRMLFSGTEYSDSNSDSGYNDWREEWDSDLSGTLKLSYASIVLNYYF
jgi:hypothetical protein